MPHARAALLALVALAAVPVAAGEALDDPAGDADGLDAVEVAWTVGASSVAVEVRFAPGDATADRAVRGVLLIGQPGAAEPAEWYQFTIANETYAFVGHDGPRAATVLNSSWTGDVARVDLRRESPAADGLCAFAVVEAGTLTDEGFRRSDVAPSGFSSLESAWPVDACPPAHAQASEDEAEDKDKDSPGFSAPALVCALAVLVFVRRRR